MTDSTPQKLLALDVSKNRIGFAVNVGNLAFGRGSLERKKHARDINAVLARMRAEGAEALVLGLPLRTDGQPSPVAQRVRSFGYDLVKAGVRVYYQDERFTTRRARELGAQDLDEAAAVQILELFLQRGG
ncbi:RuvX/YqgF family protein [Deinococcus peraridilitoris]|uniref:Putative pre-16S rRNA nuclease n=1 Tax=Deinococcus peraridilitoris (strain DSM 19664 / LMG 22246 / CIP 109416 / KR-200) TaxID=937777 RepID=L0A2Y3_DEIPD|nr:RuvX/YqgF family protein [Deinococcus peraridilitoris]AFZ67370.1 putative endonuclease involved in recombination [Deinococcus peraridilitoris DSM 19664]